MNKILLSLVKKHKTRTAITLFVIIFASLLNGISLTLLSPVLKVLFQSTSKVVSPGNESSGIWRLLLWWFTGVSPMVAVFRLAIAITGLYLLKTLFDFLQRLLVTILQEKIVRDLRNRLYRHVIRLPLSTIRSHSTGEWTARFLSDADQLKEAITNGIFVIAREGLNAAAYLTVAIIASWQLSLFALVVVPLFSFLIIQVGKHIQKRSARVQSRVAKLGKHLAESIDGIKVVKGFAMEPKEEEKFKRLTQSHYRSVIRRAYLSTLGPPLTEFLSAIAAALILLFGSHLIFVTHALSPDRFFVFLASALSMMAPFKRISQGNAILQQGLGAGSRIFNILELEKLEKKGTLLFKGLRESIVFENVHFGYRDGIPAVSGISFEIKKGEKVALIGPSGSGKTTVVDLLMGFYTPSSGKILIDGVDLNEFDLESYRKSLAFVPQDIVLFSGTIYDNIAYANPDASHTEVEKAARLARVTDFASTLPYGLNTDLGESANNLSGGEKQRVALARAILRNPEIIILDEATSSLDPETENLVQDFLWKTLASRTAIIIAHKLNTIVNADKIILMNKGKIAAIGKHDELIKKSNLYRNLYRAQFREGIGTTVNQ